MNDPAVPHIIVAALQSNMPHAMINGRDILSARTAIGIPMVA